MTTNSIRVGQPWDEADVRQSEECPVCEGHGQVWDLHIEYVDGHEVYEEWLPCDTCSGTGVVAYGSQGVRRD